MESVITKIRKAREKDNLRKTGGNSYIIAVDKCEVTVKFSENGDNDNKILASIKNSLVSAYVDAAFSKAKSETRDR